MRAPYADRDDIGNGFNDYGGIESSDFPRGVARAYSPATVAALTSLRQGFVGPPYL
jgi:hypothetical protein